MTPVDAESRGEQEKHNHNALRAIGRELETNNSSLFIRAKLDFLERAIWKIDAFFLGKLELPVFFHPN